MKKQGKSLRDLAGFMTEYPQRLVNIPVREKIPLDQLPDLAAAIAEAEKDLAGIGRVNVRYSGTENKIRILSEAKTADRMQLWLDRLVETVKKELA